MASLLLLLGATSSIYAHRPSLAPTAKANSSIVVDTTAKANYGCELLEITRTSIDTVTYRIDYRPSTLCLYAVNATSIYFSYFYTDPAPDASLSVYDAIPLHKSYSGYQDEFELKSVDNTSILIKWQTSVNAEEYAGYGWTFVARSVPKQKNPDPLCEAPYYTEETETGLLYTSIDPSSLGYDYDCVFTVEAHTIDFIYYALGDSHLSVYGVDPIYDRDFFTGNWDSYKLAESRFYSLDGRVMLKWSGNSFEASSRWQFVVDRKSTASPTASSCSNALNISGNTYSTRPLYIGGMDCTFTVSASELHFSWFDTEYYYDKLTIYNAFPLPASAPYYYSGYLSPFTVYAVDKERQEITLNWRTTFSSETRGWSFRITPPVPPTPSRDCIELGYVIKDGDTYRTPDPYSNNVNCNFTANASSVTFTRFRTESGFDYLYVYGVDPVIGPQSGEFYENELRAYEGTDGFVTFSWQTDSSVTYSGWEFYVNGLHPSSSKGSSSTKLPQMVEYLIAAGFGAIIALCCACCVAYCRRRRRRQRRRQNEAASRRRPPPAQAAVAASAAPQRSGYRAIPAAAPERQQQQQVVVPVASVIRHGGEAKVPPGAVLPQVVGTVVAPAGAGEAAPSLPEIGGHALVAEDLFRLSEVGDDRPREGVVVGEEPSAPSVSGSIASPRDAYLNPE